MKSEDIKQLNYEKIKSTSSVLFFIQGIEATNMHQIAAASGISKVSIYKHFESKYDIVREILYDYMDASAARLDEEWIDNPNESGAARLQRLLQMLTTLSEDDIIFYTLFMEYAIYLQRIHKSQVPQLFEKFDAPFRSRFIPAIELGRKDGSLTGGDDAATLFEIVTGAVRGTCMLFFAKNAGDLSDDYLNDLNSRLTTVINGFMLLNTAHQ